MKSGLLLINIGTPDSPKRHDVRNYLKQFLSDPRVLDIPTIARWILLYGFILPFRPKKSAAAYQQIWTEQGSPLLVNSKIFAEQLQEKLGHKTIVSLGMRYGNPSIASAIDHLSMCDKIIVLPLFPQYSSAATGSALEQVLKIYAKKINIPQLQIIQNFYHQDFFINPYAELIKKNMIQFSPEFTLFSYHGLPQRQVDNSGCDTLICDRQQNCPKMSEKNHYCYRAQCYATTALLAKTLSLEETQYTTSFQSRLGKTPWIKPYTDKILQQLIDRGIKRLAVVCPAFTVDCLETLEEVSIRLKDQWLSLGGEAFQYIPCLNTETAWIDFITAYIKTLI